MRGEIASLQEQIHNGSSMENPVQEPLDESITYDRDVRPLQKEESAKTIK